MLFETNRPIVLIILIFMLSGCFEAEEKKSQNNTPSAVVSIVEKNIKRAYLPFSDTINNRESIAFFQTEGTRESTKKLHEKSSNNPENFKYNILQNFTVLGNFIYYDYIDAKTSNEFTHIQQLRTSVKEGTTIVSEEIEASNNNNPKINRIKNQEQLYVQSIDSDFISNVTKYDLNGSIFPILTDFNTTISLSKHPLQILNNELYMLAKDFTDNYIVHFNQNESNASLFKIINQHNPLQFYALNNQIYLLLNDRENSPELLGYNPQDNSIKRHFTFNMDSRKLSFNPAISPSVTSLIAGDKLYLSFPFEGTEIYVFDSNSKDMKLIFKESFGFMDTFIAYKNKVYFSSSSTPSAGFWQTEGTDESTTQLQDEKGHDLTAKNITYIHNKLYFSHYRQTEGEELWVFDGSRSRLLLDINKGTGSSFPQYMTELNEGIVFQASPDGQNNKLLYFDDINLTTLN